MRIAQTILPIYRQCTMHTAAVTNEFFITILPFAFDLLPSLLQFDWSWAKRISLRASLSTFGFASVLQCTRLVRFHLCKSTEKPKKREINWKRKENCSNRSTRTRSHHPTSISYQIHETQLAILLSNCCQKEINFSFFSFALSLTRSFPRSFSLLYSHLGVFDQSLTQVEINVIALKWSDSDDKMNENKRNQAPVTNKVLKLTLPTRTINIKFLWFSWLLFVCVSVCMCVCVSHGFVKSLWLFQCKFFEQIVYTLSFCMVAVCPENGVYVKCALQALYVCGFVDALAHCISAFILHCDALHLFYGIHSPKN